jgi:dCTP deaminase
MAIDRGVPRVKEIVATLLPVDRLRPAGPNLYRRVQAIRDGLPPYLPGDDSESFGEIMAAGWARTLHDADRLHAGSGASDEYQRDCRLVLKALELASASLHSIEQERGWVPSVSAATGIGGVLGREALVDRCQRSSIAQRLVVMPPGKNAFQAASVDLRLGQWFKVARRTRLKSIDLTSASGRRTATQAAHEEFFLPFGQSLTVHPGDFVLAVTLEYIAIPCDLMGTVEGRSGAGRTGLTIATATPVSPGFKGSVVLELAHAGAVPITIAPGLGIAQMLLYQLSAPTEAYSGRFQCQTRP